MQAEPFEISIAEDVLEDLRRRIAGTRWAPSIPGMGWDYGFDADYLRKLAGQWLSDYDWRAAERRMNAFSHYRAKIDDIPIHFILHRGKGPAPIPLILTHGWPWTFWDMHKVIGPLSDPGAHGGDPADAFDVVVASPPGFTFSTPLPRTGLTAEVIGDLWHKLMTEVLGYPRYAAAGGDWGARMTEQLGHKYAASLYGIHLAGTSPVDLFNGERYWDITSALLPYDAPAEIRKPLLARMVRGVSHVAVQTVEPQTLSFAMHDSPVGMLAWLVQRRKTWGHLTNGDVESAFPAEHLLTTATLYWATESFATAARLYREAILHRWTPAHDRSPRIEAPAGITFLGGENAPGMTTEQRIAGFKGSPRAAHYNIHLIKGHDRGGHFAHYENPEACVADIRETFRDLRRR
jgi:pimeloyl-ACP methyl ester carboxylesterase